MTSCKTTAPRWKSYFRYHLVLILSRNETLIHESTSHVAHFHINMVLSTRNMFKEVKVIKSRGGRGLPTHQYVEPAVNRQPGFRRKLVEQIIHRIRSPWNSLHEKLLNYQILAPADFLEKLHENSKISLFVQHVRKHTLWSLIKVWSSTGADIHTKSNFDMI